MSRLAQAPLLPFGVAAVCVAGATGGRLLLDPLLGDQLPFHTYFLAVVLATWYAGVRPALLAVALSAVAANYFFLPPRGQLWPTGPDQWVGTGVFVGTGVGIALLGGERQAGQRRAADARLRTMADAMPQIVWAAGPDGVPHYLNSRWTEYTGLTTIRPEDTSAVVHPDDQERVAAVWERARQSGTPYAIELRMKSAADGRYRWFLSRAVPVTAGGRVVEWFGTSTDIDELKTAEQAHERAERMLQLVLDNIPQGVVWKDRNSRYLGCNAVVAEVMKLPSTAAIVGRTDADFPSFTPEQIEFFIRKDREVMDADEAQMHIVEPLTRADGRTVWLDTTKVPMHDDAGRVIGVLVTCEDITERRQSEEAIRRSERRFRALLEHSTDSIAVITADNTILYHSPSVARVEGYTAAELAQRNGLENTHPDDVPYVHTTVSQLLARPGEPIPVRWRRKHKDGRWLWLEGVAINLLDDPAVGGIVTNYRDVTDRLKAEETLRTSEERLRLATEAAGMGTWERNLKTGQLYWSASLERMMGFAPGTFPGTYEAFVALVEPADRPLLETARQRVREEGGEYHVELRFRLADGESRTGLLRGQIIRDEHGRPDRLVGIQMDVTDRRRLEDEREKLSLLIEKSHDFIAMAELDGRLTFMNAGARRMIGLDDDIEPGRVRFTDYVPDEWQAFFRDTVVRTTPEQGQWEGEMQLRHTKTGALIDVHRSAFLIRDSAGAESFATVTRDITASKRAMDALRESESRFRGAFEHTNLAMGLTSIDNRFIRVNNALARMFGYTPEEFLTRTMADITHPDHLADSYAQRVDLLAGQSDYFVMEKRYRTKDGAELWGLTNVSLVRDSDGNPSYYFGQVQDITTRKRAEAELRRLNTELEARIHDRTAELQAANKELEAFSYSVSHDLRAPLRAIDGFARILDEDYATDLPPAAAEFLRDIRTSTQLMGRLVDDLLAFSKLGRQVVRKQAIDTGEMVRYCLDELRAANPDRRIDVRVGDLPPAFADPSLLKQVWRNLLGNAYKYTGTRPEAVVEVGAADGPAGPTFFVRDNGVGFDMRYAHKLFGVFQRLHRAEEFEGTGVGLAIVQRIVHRHGGQVWAASEPDRGATFSFTLPTPEGQP